MKKPTKLHGIIVGAALAVVATLTVGPSHPQHVGPPQLYPPSSVTGVANQSVTQDNIQETICRAGWTATIRPPVSYTNNLKDKQMIDMGLCKNTNPGLICVASDFEEDHFISLELGGDPKDPKNLWPEPYNSTPVGARQKDQTENFLHAEVCNGTITLKEAQKAVTTDWWAIFSAGKADSASPVDNDDE